VSAVAVIAQLQQWYLAQCDGEWEHHSGIDINTIGWILMIVGAIGILLSLLFWSSWGGVGGTRRRTTVVDDGPPAY